MFGELKIGYNKSTESYMANKKQFRTAKTAAQVLLELSGSWEDSRGQGEIVAQIKSARNILRKPPSFTSSV